MCLCNSPSLERNFVGFLQKSTMRDESLRYSHQPAVVVSPVDRRVRDGRRKTNGRSIIMLIAATRLHLGQASKPPESWTSVIQGFADTCRKASAGLGYIAVDATPTFPEYDLVEQVKKACSSVDGVPLRVIPVTPWGMFVPALNAIIAAACAHKSATSLLLVSAETTTSEEGFRQLVNHLVQGTLVVGAVLPGHQYRQGRQVLNGRTCPWNTLALWDLRKLALTGFCLVSEGLLTDEPSHGVEEVAAIVTLQRILGDLQAVAKLVQLDQVDWQDTFDSDPARRAWHEEKMKSKLDRAARQLDLLQLSGIVEHL